MYFICRNLIWDMNWTFAFGTFLIRINEFDDADFGLKSCFSIPFLVYGHMVWCC